MKPHPHCYYCGRGLSQKHRIGPELRLLLAILGGSSIACQSCADRIAHKYL